LAHNRTGSQEGEVLGTITTGPSNNLVPEAAADRALQLDVTLAEPYNTPAAIKFIEIAIGPRLNKRSTAMGLDPNFAEIHIHYAMCLMLFGRDNDALKEIKRSANLFLVGRVSVAVSCAENTAS
jgi:hypothetical protein